MTSDTASPMKPMEKFVQDLKTCFAQAGGKPDTEEVKRMFRSYLSNHQDWKEYCFFNEVRYARNLVERNQYFELIVICWKAGQQSPIHNHEGSSCWMACAEGKIEEQYFHVEKSCKGPSCCGSSEPCPVLRSGAVSHYTKGQVAYIADEIALHRIRPANDSDLVSLHMYSPPINECLIYCPELNRCSRVKLGYYTENKIRVSQPSVVCS